MSIINDALKKTQQSLGPGNPGQKSESNETKPQLGDDRFNRPATGAPEPGKNFSAFASSPFATNPTPPPGPQPAKPTAKSSGATSSEKPHRPRTVWLLLVLFLLGGYYAYKNNILPKDPLKRAATLTKKIWPGKTTSTKPSSGRPTLPLPRNLFAPPPAAEQRNDLMLNGVVDIQEKIVALINNEIYEVGDNVHGWDVLEIGPNFVRLGNQGQTITLKIDGARE